MHQAVQESACGEDHCLGAKSHAQHGLHTLDYPTLNHEFIDRILPHVQIRCILEHFSPLQDELLTVTLRTRTPHGGTLAAVEHTELDAAAVGNDTHLAAQRIDFAHNLPLGNASHSGIAAHLGNLVHVDGDEQRARPQACCSSSRFTAGMTGAHHYDIIVASHFQTGNQSLRNTPWGSMARAAFSCCSMISRSPGPLSLMPHRCSTPWMMTRINSPR